MDSDEFDDDIADEDLIIAASQATVPALSRAQPAKTNQGRFQPHVQQTPLQRNSANTAQRGSVVCICSIPIIHSGPRTVYGWMISIHIVPIYNSDEFC